MKFIVLINLTYNMKLKSFYIFIIFLNLCNVCISQDFDAHGKLGNLTHFDPEVVYSDDAIEIKQTIPDQDFIVNEIKNAIPNLDYQIGIAEDGFFLFLINEIYKIHDGYYGYIRLECRRIATVKGTQYMNSFTVYSNTWSFISINESLYNRVDRIENSVKNLIKDFAIMYYKANDN